MAHSADDGLSISLAMRNRDVTVARPCAKPPHGKHLREEDRHLKTEHGLARVVAWVREPQSDNLSDSVRSPAAERMARCRARKVAAGIVSFDVPAPIVDRVKAAGGWDAWINEEREAAILEYQRESASDRPPDTEALALGRQARQARGWRRVLIRWLLGLT